MTLLQGGRSSRFMRNVTWNTLGQVLVGAINFFTLPYIIRMMGLERYGLYLILHAAAGYLLLFSFGAGSPTLKYVAFFGAAKDRTSILRTVKYAIMTYSLGALLGAGLLWSGAGFFASRLFHVQGPLYETATYLLRCAAAGALFVALIQASTSILQGLERFDYSNMILFLQNGLMPVGTVLVLARGHGIAGVGVWYLTLNMAACLFCAVTTRRLLRPVLRDAAAPSASRTFGYSAFARFGLSQWLGPLAWIITYQGDKIFIARSVSLTALALYSVPVSLLQRIQVLSGVVCPVVLPMMSALDGPDAEESLKRIYLKTARFLLSAALPLLALLFALIPQFLGLWLGGEFSERSVWPARLIIIAQVFNFLAAMPGAVALSRGKPQYLPAMAWAQAIISLLAWRMLIPRYELLGVAIGSLLAQAIPACVCLWLTHRNLLHLPLRQFAAEALRMPFLSAGLMLAAILPLHALATDWTKMILLSAGGVALYGLSCWLLAGHEDRALLKSYLVLQQPG